MILLAEDDHAIRSLLARALRARGFSVTEAADGAAALAIAEAAAEPYRLLVTDVLMPGLSGPELARILRARGRIERVIYVTGYSDSVIDAAELDLVLCKPFSPRALAEAVQQVFVAG